MSHTEQELFDETVKTSNLVLLARLEESLPKHVDRISRQRFFEQAKPILEDWLSARFESEAADKGVA